MDSTHLENIYLLTLLAQNCIERKLFALAFAVVDQNVALVDNLDDRRIMSCELGLHKGSTSDSHLYLFSDELFCVCR